MTNAQVELMAIDISILVTPKHKRDKGNDSKDGKPKRKQFKAPSASKIDEVTQKWLAKYGNKQQEKINFKDVF